MGYLDGVGVGDCCAASKAWTGGQGPIAAIGAFFDSQFTAFTTNFEDLGGLRQLPGLAVQRLMADGYGFGGEQSGHIIFRDGDATTGDGLLTALRVLEVMARTGQSLSELVGDLKVFPQTIKNVRVREKTPLVLLSAPDHQIDLRRCREFTIEHFLKKPLRPPTPQTNSARWVSRRKLRSFLALNLPMRRMRYSPG